MYKVISEICNYVDFIGRYSCQNIVSAECKQKVNNNTVKSEWHLTINNQK